MCHDWTNLLAYESKGRLISLTAFFNRVSYTTLTEGLVHFVSSL